MGITRINLRVDWRSNTNLVPEHQQQIVSWKKNEIKDKPITLKESGPIAPTF